MKNKKKVLAILMLLALFLSACAAPPQETQPPTEPTLPPATEPATEPATVPETVMETTVPPTTEGTETEPTSADGSVPLSEDEIAALTKLFTQEFAGSDANAEIPYRNWYNMLMTCKFDTPAQIEIRQLFSSGVGGSDPPSVDDADLEFLKTKEQIIQHLDIYKIPRETAEEVLHTYLGITLDELDGVGMDKMVYWDETDCYYYNGTGNPCADPFTITEGYHTPDGKIIIFYSIATL